MGMEFRLETNKHISKYRVLMLLFRNDNQIDYDYDIYSILINNKVIGYITKYKVPANKSCYIDIFIFSEYRNRGYGSRSLSLFIDKISCNYDEIYIRSNQTDKTRFLLRNKFELVRENLNKNLYLRVLKS